MATRILPGLTNTVTVPSYADFIDSVIRIEVIFKRPDRKERKKITEFLRETLQQSYDYHEQHLNKLKSLEAGKKTASEIAVATRELEKERDALIKANNKKVEVHLKKYYQGVADFEYEGETVSFTEKEALELLDLDGYGEAIGRAFTYLYTQEKPEDYTRGYDEGSKN